MGWCVGNLGWSCDEVASKIREFDGPKYIAPQYAYKRQAELEQLLADITPGSLSKCIYTTSGTESVEAALKVAKLYTGREKFAAIKDSYHGNSMAVTAIAQNGQIEPPLNTKALTQVERILKSRKYAAFIMEPIICNLGVEMR